jgi:ethanolaminephosphotransferase
MAAPKQPPSTAPLLVIANLLIPLSLLVFGTGFFPYKPFIPGLAQYEALEYGPPPQPPFDKLVFMVVDALRRYAPSLTERSTLLILTMRQRLCIFRGVRL